MYGSRKQMRAAPSLVWLPEATRATAGREDGG